MSISNDWEPMMWRNKTIKAKIVYWPHDEVYSLIIGQQRSGPYQTFEQAVKAFNEPLALDLNPEELAMEYALKAHG